MNNPLKTKAVTIEDLNDLVEAVSQPQFEEAKIILDEDGNELTFKEAFGEE